MEIRVNMMEKGGNGLKALYGVGGYLRKSKVDHGLLELIAFRIAQMNGCAFCLDMHAKEARAAGETEQRIYSLSAWREMSIYTERERAALAWAEAVNRHDVPQGLFDEVKNHFSDEEIFDITLSVGTSSTWNKLNIALTR